jgi:hypothetical protein
MLGALFLPLHAFWRRLRRGMHGRFHPKGLSLLVTQMADKGHGTTLQDTPTGWWQVTLTISFLLLGIFQRTCHSDSCGWIHQGPGLRPSDSLTVRVSTRPDVLSSNMHNRITDQLTS